MAVSTFATKTVVRTGTPWESRTNCARLTRVGDTCHISITAFNAPTPREQVLGIMDMMDKAIKEAGGRGRADITAAHMIAADVKRDFKELGDAHKEAFAHTGNRPANTLVGGSFAVDWMLVEMWATAVIQPTPAATVVRTGTPWEERTNCARLTRVGDLCHISITACNKPTPREQVLGIMDIMDKAIKEAGGRGLADIVMTHMFAADIKRDFKELGDTHKEVFACTDNIPANTLVGASFAVDWMLVEMWATAVIQSTPAVTVVRTGTGWEERANCARLTRVGDLCHISITAFNAPTPREQVLGIMNIMDKAIKEAGGRGLADIVMTHMFAADIKRDFKELGDTHKEAFAGTDNIPANTLVGQDFAVDWMLVEMWAVAIVGQGKQVVLDIAKSKM